MNSAPKMGLAGVSDTFISVTFALAIKLKIVFESFDRNEVSMEQLEQALHNTKKAGAAVDDPACKRAEVVLQTTKQQAIDELNKPCKLIKQAVRLLNGSSVLWTLQ